MSSPGLERPLRTPAHFGRAVGKPGLRQDHARTTRRTAALDGHASPPPPTTTVTVALDEPVGESVTLPFDDIEKARTIFEWGPAPKPGGPKNKNTPTTKPTTQKKKVQP